MSTILLLLETILFILIVLFNLSVSVKTNKDTI